MKKYYEAHKQDFNRPEQVALAEIFLSTEGKSPEEIAAVRTRADDLHNRLVKGEDFTGSRSAIRKAPRRRRTATLGEFERGQLAKQLEDAVFNAGQGPVHRRDSDQNRL